MKAHHFVLSCALLSVSGCGQTVRMELPTTGNLDSTGPDGTRHQVLLRSECAGRLATWVENNAAGWARYYATPPSGGVGVQLGSVQVRFYDSGALAKTPEGWFGKSSAFADYQCLISSKANGT
jgi:hypothetical protein